MYTKYEFNKYYLGGEVIEEPIHVKVDLNQCGTVFPHGKDGNMTGFIYPIKMYLSGDLYALFVSDIPNELLHDGNGCIDYQNLYFYNRCWYIEYNDYIYYKNKKIFRV